MIDLTVGTTLIKLRDQFVRIHYRIGSPEPDVGLSSWFIDDYWLEDRKTGERLNWDLTDSEDQQVIDLIIATENYEKDKRRGFDPFEDEVEITPIDDKLQAREDEDEDEPRRSWRRRNPNAPTGTGRS